MSLADNAHRTVRVGFCFALVAEYLDVQAKLPVTEGHKKMNQVVKVEDTTPLEQTGL